MKTILSLFDYTGNWSQPYREAGYTVLQRDLQFGNDIFRDLELVMYDSAEGLKIHGLMAAVPCTDFANSGARWWKNKESMPAPKNEFFDADTRLEYFTSMVLCVLAMVEWLQPSWWVIENPIGRIQKLVPEIGPCRLWFQPSDFGDPYTKKTGLWGNFNSNLPKSPVLPLFGSEMHKTSSANKEKRSTTPQGFAKAFFQANP